MVQHMEKYNEDLAMTLARDYTKATGVECLLVQSDGIYNPCSGAVHKEFCFQKNREIEKYCINTHSLGAAGAKNKGKCVSYFCPMGLMHWTAPIVIDGQICGSFIAGHVFFDDAKENAAKHKELSSLHEKFLTEHPELRDSLLSSEIIDDERLNSLKNILSLMATQLSNTKTAPKSVTEIENLLNKDGKSSEMLHSNDGKWIALGKAIKEEIPKSIDDSLEKVVHEVEHNQRSLEEEKNDLAHLILLLHDKYNEDSEGNFLTETCISALGEIEYIKDKAVLALWIKKNIRNLLEAAYYLPSIKNADMIYSALHYINTHYSEKITLQEISDYVHFSPPYFSKMFKKELNMTFVQYLTKTRIEKSKDLLADTAIPLPEIPGLVGFEEQSYFTKVFRATTGISPGKYREQITA